MFSYNCDIIDNGTSNNTFLSKEYTPIDLKVSRCATMPFKSAHIAQKLNLGGLTQWKF